MRKLFIFTLGFEEKFAIRMITAHGLDEGDKLLMITGPLVEKTQRTISFIRDFLNKYFSGKVAMEVFELKDISDFPNLVDRLYDKLRDEVLKFDEIIVNLSGGMRVIVLATYTALTLLLLSIKDIGKIHVELETEDSSARISIPIHLAKLLKLRGSLSHEKVQVLKLISCKPMTAKEIAQALGKDETTIRRHLMELVSLGLVVRKETRPFRYVLSKDYVLFIKLLQSSS